MNKVSINTVITTERLQLRAVSYDDIPFVFEAAQFPGFCDGMRWDPPESPDELKLVTAKNIESWVSGTQYTFTIDLIDPAVPVGRIALRPLQKGVWYLGFWVDPNHWGKGIATEAAKALVAFAFNELAATAVLSSHATWNVASQRVIEKVGMQLIGHNPEAFMKNGAPVEELEYALVR
jgi:[ribosomal protein S5]-alanine N-acetyltransferase